MSVSTAKKDRGKPRKIDLKLLKTSAKKSDAKGKKNADRIIKSVRSSGKEKLTNYITPMLAHIHGEAFDDKDWLFEVKWDGYRAIAEISKNNIRLYSRNGLSFLSLYPKVASALTKIKEDVILDGEIVVLNRENKPDFQKLQQYYEHNSLPILYYVFDCLYYQGKSIMGLPLRERKKIAKKVIPKSDIIKYSDHVEKNGIEFFKRVIDMNVEGMIAKRADSQYVIGKRTRDWLKIKNHQTQEAIIAGFTAPRGSRTLIGALVLAINDNGKLKYIGHTGTGFTNESLRQLHQKLQPLKRTTSPLQQKVPVNSPVTWVEPVLVCNVKYTEITADGILRHPVFQGLRVDKTAEETTSMDYKATLPAEKESPSKEKKPKSSETKEIVRINGHSLTLTNQKKIYWPGENITKGDVLKYYNAIHKFILPYLKDRPQSLKRNPNGITNPGFFQKDAGDAPSWIKSVPLRAESANRTIDYILCNDRATLAYLNNLGCIEFNPWNSRVAKLDYPDYMVFDLDPADENTFDQVVETALVIRDILNKAGADSYCKTSGASGLHVYVPLHARYTYEQIRSFAEIVVRLTEEQLPRTTTVVRSLDKRNGRIYLDYLQNKKGQTLASVYSIRPKPGAPVSAPLLWREVKPGLRPSQFNIHNMIRRLETSGDLFAGVLTGKIDLEKCINNLEA
jgi:bifunctional non-homologous end joining protein LigD